MLKNIFIAIFILDIFIVNLLLGFLLYRNFVRGEVINNKTSIDTFINEERPNEVAYCDQECKAEIVTRIEGIERMLKITAKPSATPTPLITNIKQKVRGVTYVPIPGSGNTVQTTWTDLLGTEFYLNKSDYSGYIYSELEVNMRLQNGNGAGYVRLYDVTNKRAVDGSELQTASQNSTVVVSGGLSLWEGNNLYRIQVKSLTADVTYFESGRIKIITEKYSY